MEIQLYLIKDLKISKHRSANYKKLNKLVKKF